ncbi:hypothetical protein OPT61_g10490 [Boeremia exigua]|uniref:Uncharacterized protein n=1 Tax=Boeremia exigua TaxID=749465 RepID=A0ACC2HPU0_9PLEO|nr:hypothetical protein OPT61_g10490 [Boeremia exigua]
MYDGDKGEDQGSSPAARLVRVRENVPLQPNSITVIKIPPQGEVGPWPFMKPFQRRFAVTWRGNAVNACSRRKVERESKTKG